MSHCLCLHEGSHVPRRGVWGGSFRWRGRDLVLLLRHGPAVWQSLEHLQSDPQSKVQTLEVTRTEAPDTQKEDPYLLRSEVVCAVAVEGICVIGVKKKFSYPKFGQDLRVWGCIHKSGNGNALWPGLVGWWV